MKTTADLLYPASYSAVHDKAPKISEAVVNNLELESLAMLLCPYNYEYALKILSELPSDINVIKFRQDILEDFLNIPQLEGVLYNSLHTIYNNSKSVYAKVGSTQSFFELNENIEHIDSFIDCMENCHNFYERCYDSLKSEGVRDIVMSIEDKYNSADYKTLVTENEKLKKVLATGVKSVTFGVNLDNMMRPTEIALLEVSNEPFRKKGLFEKLFSNDKSVEPVSNIYARKSKEGGIVAINERLFYELDNLNGEYVKHFNTVLNAYYQSSINFLLKIEPQINFYIGAKNMVERSKQMKLPMCRPEIAPQEERVIDCKDIYDIAFSSKIYNSYSRNGYATTVSVNDCLFDESARVLILTGPNNGGKTTYTRAVGINQILAQSGLYTAGSSARISPVDRIFTHFPKEEEIGINTSRFTEECKEFKQTTIEATENSLILMNESISSTTPSDCLYIATELMKIFCDKGCRLLFATHMRELADKITEINAAKPKSFIGCITAECGENGRPTYKITRRLPEKNNNAKQIFERFGISFEKYLEEKQL